MHRHSCSIRTVRGELASHDSWQRGRRTEAFFLVFLNPSSLPRNNRLACHSTTLASDEATHVTPDIPLVEVGPFYFLGGGPPSRLSPDSRTNRQELACGVLN